MPLPTTALNARRPAKPVPTNQRVDPVGNPACRSILNRLVVDDPAARTATRRGPSGATDLRAFRLARGFAPTGPGGARPFAQARLSPEGNPPDAQNTL